MSKLSTIHRFVFPAMLVAFLIGSSAIAAPPGSGWRLHFADEFSGDTVDTTKWQTRYPWGRTHNHQAYMRDENVVLGDGNVSLVATRESYGGKPFTSGIISTGYSKYKPDGGYFEARILLPDTTGSWPAFWGLDSGWPPEADIMEYPLGAYTNAEYHTAFHYSTGGGNASGAGKVNPGGIGDLRGQYHTFGMEWASDDYVRFFFNGNQVSSFGTDSAITQMSSMYLLLNYAVGGWPGTPSQAQWPDGWSDQTKVDWVRVWQKPAITGESTWTYNGSSSASWGSDANWSSFAPAHGQQTARLNTLAGQANMQLTWNQLKAVGHVYIDGTTAYTIGDSSSDSLMFSDESDSWARLWVDGGAANHAVESRVEVRDNLSIRNIGTGSLTINGDMIGHARGSSTGEVHYKGAGQIVLNGVGSYQGSSKLSENADVTVNGSLYQGRVMDWAMVAVDDGATLSLDNVDDLNNNGSLGALLGRSEKLRLNNGTLELRGNTETRRGFTIGAGGATLRTTSGADVWFRLGDHLQVLANPLDAPLMLDGAGSGRIDKAINGGITLTKSGTGDWMLGGNNQYSGPTLIQQGTLYVNSTAGNGNATVSVGAKLGGHGTINGTVSNYGTVGPGINADLLVYEETAGELVFDFTGVQDDAPLTATSSLPAEMTLVSGFDFGPGVQARGTSNNGNEFNVRDWYTVTLEEAIADDDYLTFSVAPVAGLEMQVGNVSYTLWRNEFNGQSGAPKQYAVLTSMDGFTQTDALGGVSFELEEFGQANTKSFTAEYRGGGWTSGTVETRLYGWDGHEVGHTHVTDVRMTANFRTIGGVTLTPTGSLDIAGDFLHVAGAMVDLEMQGTDNSDPDAQEFDTIAVTGDVTLAGGIKFGERGSYKFRMGDAFVVMTADGAGGISGTFDPTQTFGWDMLDTATDNAIAIFYDDGADADTLVDQVRVVVTARGDVNGDGTIGPSDLTNMKLNWLSNAATWAEGDTDYDGTVGPADLTALKLSWLQSIVYGEEVGEGHIGGGPGGGIPEPASAALLALGGLALLRRRVA